MLLISSCDVREKEKPKITTEKEPVSLRIAPEKLLESIRDGDTTAFMSWLFDGPNLNQQYDQGVTVLIAASEWNRPSYVSDLLEQGANPNIQDGKGRTALHAAAASNNLAIITLLLDGGINPTLSDANGLTAKDVAAIRQHRDAVSLLSKAIDSFLAAHAPPEKTIPEETTEITEAVLLSTDFRVWTSASGDQLDAAFIQSIFDTVILQAKDGTMLRISINRLSASDQMLARKLSGIDPHALAGARGARSTGRSTRSMSSSSLSAKIGNDGGWTKLEGCRLLKNPSNDGDSFHVKHDGKEYIFRLYYVDAAETDNGYPDRVRDQAKYFKLSTDATMKLGREASKFTTSLLAGSPFTVYTRWVDARGSSQLKRHFALIETPLGDLDELLTREGLVRQYGLTINGGHGQKKGRILSKLEKEARREKAGGWKD